MKWSSMRRRRVCVEWPCSWGSSRETYLCWRVCAALDGPWRSLAAPFLCLPTFYSFSDTILLVSLHNSSLCRALTSLLWPPSLRLFHLSPSVTLFTMLLSTPPPPSSSVLPSSGLHNIFSFPSTFSITLLFHTFSWFASINFPSSPPFSWSCCSLAGIFSLLHFLFLSLFILLHLLKSLPHYDFARSSSIFFSFLHPSLLLLFSSRSPNASPPLPPPPRLFLILLADYTRPRLPPPRASMIFTAPAAALTRQEVNDYTVDGNVTITPPPRADRSLW